MIPATAGAMITADMQRYLVARAEELRLAARRHLSDASAAGSSAAVTAALRAIGDESFLMLDRLIAQHRESIAAFASDLAAVQCRSGCTFCCHFNVEVTPLEALRIAAEMEAGAVPDRRSAIAATAPKIAGLSRDARRRTGIACSLLADGACTVYAQRPLACRSLLSLDAGACEADFRAGLAGGARAEVPSLSLPLLFGMAMFTGQVAALDDFRLASHATELTAALALLQSDLTARDRWLAGEDVFPRVV